jgi:DNA polymerase IIIc chi subunit
MKTDKGKELKQKARNRFNKYRNRNMDMAEDE